MLSNKWRCCIIFMLISLSLIWHGQVLCKTEVDDVIIKPPTTFQTQNGIRSVHAVSQAAKSWADAATKAAETAQKVTEVTAKSAAKIARVAGKLFKVINIVGKLAPYIGVLGFLAPFIQSFFGGEDPVIAKLNSEFFKVNKKLDGISKTLSRVDSKITFESQRAAYIGPAARISFSYEKMEEMLGKLKNSTCNSKKECDRERITISGNYLDSFKETERDLYTILQPGEASIFKEPVMNLVRINYECDVPEMVDIFGRLFDIARKAQSVIIVHKRLTSGKETVLASMERWSKLIYNFRRDMYRNVNLCYKSMLMGYPNDPEENLIVKDLKKNSGSDVSSIRRFFELKYRWLRWVRKHCLLLIYVTWF